MMFRQVCVLFVKLLSLVVRNLLLNQKLLHDSESLVIFIKNTLDGVSDIILVLQLHITQRLAS